MRETKGIHLRSIAVDRSRPWPDGFPFNVPAIAALSQLEFTAPVTFLVGENGCGKSTLLEAIACAAGSVTVGSDEVDRDRTLTPIRALSRCLKLTWTAKTGRGFFMRSEDFFGYARRLSAMREELEHELERVEQEYSGRSRTAQLYARSAYANEIAALKEYYGEDLDARSQGESYLHLFQVRFVPGGLYLLDEPEAPLSPLRQLSLLVMLKQMIDQEAQFIIATHSPILMAFPGATILHLNGAEIGEASYDELDHVRIVKGFLNNRDSYLRRLFE